MNGFFPQVTKIADLGNACWTFKHFTDDVTTRQYRAPEVILGAEYGTAIDVWALACMVFELVTGDFMFDPKEDLYGRHTRNEDHLALMVELIGDVPANLLAQGKFGRQWFNRKGQLRNIAQLDRWGLSSVLHEKYKLPLHESEPLGDFLLSMLHMNPDKRYTAAQALKHPWLAMTSPQPGSSTTPAAAAAATAAAAAAVSI
jgi:serine/threonine-protein kinase SRPK3